MAYDAFHVRLTIVPPWSLCSSHTAVDVPLLREFQWRGHLLEPLIPRYGARHWKLGFCLFQTHSLIISLWTWNVFIAIKAPSLPPFKVQLKSHLLKMLFVIASPAPPPPPHTQTESLSIFCVRMSLHWFFLFKPSVCPSFWDWRQEQHLSLNQ